MQQEHIPALYEADNNSTCWPIWTGWSSPKPNINITSVQAYPAASKY